MTLRAEQVAERYGWKSCFPVWQRTSTNTIPYVKKPGMRGYLFIEDWLDAWDRGAELEVIESADGGRIVKPQLGG
jgi:diphthamide synthase (EF-2-diphthine--ammonia ligase)